MARGKYQGDIENGNNLRVIGVLKLSEAKEHLRKRMKL